MEPLERVRLIDWLEGKKTYIIAILIIITALLHYLDIIDQDLFELLLTMLIGGGASTLSAKINKVNKKIGE